MSATTFVQTLERCRAAKGAGSKKVIKEALAGLCADGRALVRYALDPYLTYGVRKFDRPVEYAPVDGEIRLFMDVLDQLAARTLSGNAARATVTLALSGFTKATAMELERVLEKDLKAGFSPDSYNKVWPNEPLPVFDVMLAGKCEDEDDFDEKITFPCFADWKYDGERTIAIVEGDKITYHSRSGLEAEHCYGLFDEDLLSIRRHVGHDFVLDAERFAADWADTMNAKKSDNLEAKARLRLRAFFLMPLADWKAKRTTITMQQNRANLEAILHPRNGVTKISLSEGREVADYADMVAYCDEVTTPGFDGQPKGHEGLILKDLGATYVWDRDMAWCKVKKFYDVDCRIVGFLPGRPKSKFEHTLGKLQVVGFLENGTRVECNVGSGIKSKKPKDEPGCPTRDEIWNDKARFLGGTVVVSYQEVSMAKGKDVHSLRFCTVSRFRDDKPIELDEDDQDVT